MSTMSLGSAICHDDYGYGVYIMHKSRGAKKIILKNKWTKKSYTFINEFGDKLKQKGLWLAYGDLYI